MKKQSERSRLQHWPADPDPVAIVTLCFGGVSMVAALGNFILGLRKSRRERREESRNERLAAADFLVMADRLSGIGHRLTIAIEALSRNSGVALSFLPRARFRESGRPALTGRTMRPGQNLVHVHGASREMWEILVDDVCGNVKTINKCVLDYTELLPQVFEELRRTGIRFEIPVDGLIEYLGGRAVALQSKADAFQGLGPKASLTKAERTFQDLCDEAQNFMRAVDEIVAQMRRSLG